MAVNPDKNSVEQGLIARLIGKIKRIALDLANDVSAEETRAMAAEAAAKTVVTAGENCSVTKTTAEDGHDVYTVNADGKPQVQADWNQAKSSKVDYIKNKPNLSAVATSGDYNDLTNKPNLALKEDVSNKAQTLDTASTTNYPSSKAVADFVNSSIATNTANFLGTYDVVNDLGLTTSATNAQIATALGSYQFSTAPTNNDYVFASIDLFITTDADEYRRFKFDGSVWAYEYTLNNSSFTAAQWAAINSGLSSSDKATYDAAVSTLNTHVADSTIHVTSTDKTTWNNKQDAISTDTDSSTISDSTTIATGYGSNKVHLSTAARIWGYIQSKLGINGGVGSNTTPVFVNSSGALQTCDAVIAKNLSSTLNSYGMRGSKFRLIMRSAPLDNTVNVHFECRISASNYNLFQSATLLFNAVYSQSDNSITFSNAEIVNDYGSSNLWRFYLVPNVADHAVEIYAEAIGSNYNSLNLIALFANGEGQNYVNGTTYLHTVVDSVPAINVVVPVRKAVSTETGAGNATTPVYIDNKGVPQPCSLKGVYFSQYDVDSLSNIHESFDNGLLVYSKYAGDVYALLDVDSNGATFIRNVTVDGKPYYSTLTVNSNNVWSNTSENVFNNIIVRKHYGANHEASVITTATDISNGYVEYALDFTDMYFGGGLSVIFVSLPNESALAYHFTNIEVMTYPYDTGNSVGMCKFTDLTHDDDGNAIGTNDEYTWIRTCNSPNYVQRIKGLKLRCYLNTTSGIQWQAGIELKLKLDFNAVRFDKL